MSLLALMLCACVQAPNVSMDRDTFMNVMKGLHFSIRDVSFVYEGKVEFVGRSDLLKGRPREPLEATFQGDVSIRGDGSCLIDLYSKGKGIDQLLVRAVHLYHEDQLEQVEYAPDRKGAATVTARRRGSPAELNASMSPHRFLFLWFFQPQHMEDLGDFEALGWEDVDGHRCVKVRFGLYQRLNRPIKSTVTLWVDLERGGHPLKVEWRDDGILQMATRTIELARIGDKSEKIWLPVSAVFESYAWDSSTEKDPVFRETYGVVAESIRLNQGLPDSGFTLSAVERGSSSPALRQVLAEYRAAAEAAPARRPRTDRASVQARLDASLEQARRQSKLLEASSPARDAWGWFNPLQFAFVAAGVALVAAGVIYKRRLGA
jgi:hypothetical protein